MAMPMPMPGMPGMSLPPNVRPLPPGAQPPPGAQVLPPGIPPPGAMQIRVDPAMQQLLDSIPYTDVPFHLQQQPVPNTNPPQVNTLVLCPTHKQSSCEQCGVDFNGINYLHQFLRMAPSEAIPPPPQVQPPPQRAEQIKSMKEQGNVAFKAGQFPVAVQHYSRSADMALSRPPWELHAVARDEASIALCNRSAAFAFAGAWSNALADAEAVVLMKRPWTKGHFRKARALVGLGRLEAARDALIDGLQFEPNDKELNTFLKEIDEKIVEADA